MPKLAKAIYFMMVYNLYIWTKYICTKYTDNNWNMSAAIRQHNDMHITSFLIKFWDKVLSYIPVQFRLHYLQPEANQNYYSLSVIVLWKQGIRYYSTFPITFDREKFEAYLNTTTTVTTVVIVLIKINIFGTTTFHAIIISDRYIDI